MVKISSIFVAFLENMNFISLSVTKNQMMLTGYLFSLQITNQNNQ